MSIDYIRNFYGVPAKVRSWVIFDGKKAQIRGTYSSYLLIRPEGGKNNLVVHPEDESLVYPSKEASK